jgi:hypothetical protein
MGFVSVRLSCRVLGWRTLTQINRRHRSWRFEQSLLYDGTHSSNSQTRACAGSTPLPIGQGKVYPSNQFSFGRMTMRLIILLIALCASGVPVIAQTSECQSVPKASDRLACHDKAMPPSSRGKRATGSQTPSPQTDPDKDPLASENARLDAKINNICRGC